MGNDALVKLLERFGITPTSQRIRVGQVVLDRPQHVSAEEIIGRLARTGERVSKATVYNTLRLFVDKGLLREVNVDPERMFYDSTTAPHHHFYNADTGELTDIRPDEVRFEKLPRLPDGTVEEGVDVVVRVRNRS